MVTERDITIEDYDVDTNDLTWLNFQFDCNYDLFNVKVSEEEWANFYMEINPFTNEVKAFYDLSEEDYSSVYELDLSDEDKEILWNCAEKYMLMNEHTTITQFCEHMMRIYSKG